MKNSDGINLETAQRLILQECNVLSEENIPLCESLHRFPSLPLKAFSALPGFDGSLRDGYAIGSTIAKGRAENCFQVVAEVAAGDTRKIRLQPGNAVRIMTGALVPAGCKGVVPQEQCQIGTDTVTVPRHFLHTSGFFIHAKGSQLNKNSVIVPKGIPIRPEHLIDLAGVGYSRVPVVRKPLVSFFCTGSELVSQENSRLTGEKFSANPSLLQSLVTLSGAIPKNYGNVIDDMETVCQTFAELTESESDVIISTGGMGPGRYDLIEEAFSRAGGEILYRSLHLRPGKATLFGRISGKFFFGMPGPPPAVLLLFNELLRPALLALQGAKQCVPEHIHAHLTTELALPKRGLPRLKSGRITSVNGSCQVRPAIHGEPANCYIYCPANRRLLRTNEKVLVHLVSEGMATVSPPHF